MQGTIGPTGATGPIGPAGLNGPPGPDGNDGQDGSDGFPGPVGAVGPTGGIGPTGPQGVTGPHGPPGADGSDGNDGSDGPPGVQGTIGPTGGTGPTGPQGVIGPHGPPGVDGRDGEDGTPGPPGDNGAAGSAGAPGATGPTGPGGPPGRDGQDAEEPPPMFVMPLSQTTQNIVAGSPEGGLTLSATTHALEVVTTVAGDLDFEVSFQDATSSTITPGSNAGSIATATTTTAVSAPAASTGRTIVEMNLLNSDTANQTVTVQKDVSGTNFPLWGPAQLGPNERLEFTAAMGWRVFAQNGAEKTTGGSGGLTPISPGEQLGLQVDAGADAIPVRLSGAEQGENIRYTTMQDDTTTTGDQGATSYVVEEPITCVNFTAPGTVVLHGISFPGAGGGTAVASPGRSIRVHVRGSSAPIIFKHESATESNAARRFQCPLGQDLVIGPRESVVIQDDPSVNRRLVFPFQQGYQVPWDDEDFTSSTGIALGTTSTPGNSIMDNQHWHAIANVARGTTGTANHTDGHQGEWIITTGSTLNDHAAVYHTDTIASGRASTNTSVYVERITKVDFWVKISGLTNVVALFGVGTDANSLTLGTDSLFFRYDSTVGANWDCLTRNASTSTTIASGKAVPNDTYVKLTIRQYVGTNSFVLFFVDDVWFASSTTNIPSGDIVSPIFAIRATTASAKNMTIDRCRTYVTEGMMVGS